MHSRESLPKVSYLQCLTWINLLIEVSCLKYPTWSCVCVDAVLKLVRRHTWQFQANHGRGDQSDGDNCWTQAGHHSPCPRQVQDKGARRQVRRYSSIQLYLLIHRNVHLTIQLRILPTVLTRWLPPEWRPEPICYFTGQALSPFGRPTRKSQTITSVCLFIMLFCSLLSRMLSSFLSSIINAYSLMYWNSGSRLRTHLSLRLGTLVQVSFRVLTI